MKKVLFLLPFIFYLTFLLHQIDLTTSDLGRHLKNGETFIKTGQIIKTNYYSYTYSSFPVVNHHWGSGVVFYLVFQLGGFIGLQMFYAFILLLTFGLFWDIARKKIGLILTTLISFLSLLLIAQRIEIRPEIFSYFFCALIIWILENYRQKRDNRLLLLLPLISFFWINLHIYFFLSILLYVVYLPELLIKATLRKEKIVLIIILILILLTFFANPFGLSGLLSPLNIFENYGYRVVENQNIFFLEKFSPNFNFNFFIFKLTWFLFFCLAIAFLIKTKFKVRFAVFSLFIFISVLSFLQVRNIALMGFFLLLFAPEFLHPFLPQKKDYIFQKYLFKAVVFFSSFIFLFTIGGGQTLFPFWSNFGLGVISDNLRAADFYKNNKVKGPIFNNYDIGGYLIFNLFPIEKVFVDNRPEAYPASFFEKIYRPMQNDEKEWTKTLYKYKFNTIFFNRRDLTSWGQNFLIKRVKDSKWKAVYVDQNIIIFVRNKKSNQELINKYGLPEEIFGVTKI